MGLLTTCLLLISLASRIAAQNGCYYPNGEASGDIPCDSTALVSMCCGSRSSCLSSGLCLIDASETRGISYARGTCTDPTWKSPFCPQHCQLSQETAAGNTSAYDFRAGGVQVWECIGEGYAEPAAYCCESEREKTRCCQTPAAVFSLPGATIGNALAVQTFSSSASSSSDSSTTGTARTALSTVVSETPGVPSDSTTSRTGNPAQTTPADSTAEPGGGGGGLSREATLGVAITIPLVAIAALCAVLWFLWHRKRRAAGELAASAADNQLEPWQKPELDSNGVLIGTSATELDPGNEVKELGAETKIAEVYGGQHLPVEVGSVDYYELDTGTRR